MVFHLFNFTVTIKKRDITPEYIRQTIELNKIDDELRKYRDSLLYQSALFDLWHKW